MDNEFLTDDKQNLDLDTIAEENVRTDSSW